MEIKVKHPHMKRRKPWALAMCVISIFAISAAGCSSLNTNFDSHFTDSGKLIEDSTETIFELRSPSNVKFYIEVSGSMNGFFRANFPTDFKSDVWQILNNCPTSDICVLTNEGNQGTNFETSKFQTRMNTGAFISSSSTKVPIMLQTIINNLDADTCEVAVLISDMKYSPVGAAAPAVLMAQYSTDVASILGKCGKAVSLVGATSNYLDNGGHEICATSPYYFFIIGNAGQVAKTRNIISTLLEERGHFIDNIDSGFDYGKPKYSFGISNRCEQLDEQPTFTGYEECEDGDTCYLELKVDLEDYRWRITDESIFRQSFNATPKYGSEINVGEIKMDVENITGDKRELKRKAIATVKLEIFNMATDSEVIEWNLELPDTDYTLFENYLDNTTGENDPSKSYSLIDFIKGIFHGGLVNKKLSPNYILISKNS